jgi:CheY-like chemotaxis protein
MSRFRRTPRTADGVAGESILVVDDNPTNLKLVRVLLAGEGYSVRTATDAEEAFKEIRAFRPRLILMDIQLPGMDGLELTRRLKADPGTRDTLIVALTAYAMKGDLERILAAGCDGYVAKPINTRTLPAVVAGYLTGPAHKPQAGPSPAP